MDAAVSNFMKFLQSKNFKLKKWHGSRFLSDFAFNRKFQSYF